MTDLRTAAKLALEALEGGGDSWRRIGPAITALKAALGQPEEEPVAWVITDEDINSLQVASIQRLIDLLKRAHHTDLSVRVNGGEEWFQADWIKHLKRTHPPRREWRGLTDQEVWDAVQHGVVGSIGLPSKAIAVARAIEAKLKEKNA
jgi:hypothetical protein